MNPQVFQSKYLDHPNITHGFFGRQGGASSGIYESLNTGQGSNDDPKCVQRNRSAVATSLGVPNENLISVYQIHSDTVVMVNKPWARGDAPKADAMVTKEKNIALGIVTADCVPVLFADRESQIIGAAHAGWKGAFGGVIKNTVAAMESIGADPKKICAVIGPAIHQKSYEVDEGFYNKFFTENNQNDRYFVKGRKGHFQFDLIGFVRDRLVDAHVGTIDIINFDTYFNAESFFSFRRTTHNDEIDYGRQISAIALR